MINHIEKLRETEVGCSQKYGSSEIWNDNNPPNLRSLAKYHTERRRTQRSIKKTIQVKEALSVHKETEVIYQFY